MIEIDQDINSLSRFKRQTPDFIRQMKETGRPMVLTVNGKAEIVVQDAASYQRLLHLADRAEAVRGIERGLREMKAGNGTPADEFFRDLRQDLADTTRE